MQPKPRFNPSLCNMLWLLTLALLLGACGAPPLFQQQGALTASTSPSDYQAALFSDLPVTVVDRAVLEEYKAVLEKTQAALNAGDFSVYTWTLFGEQDSISANLDQAVSPQTGDSTVWIPNPETNNLLVDATIFGRTPLLILDRGGQKAVVFNPVKLEAAFGDLLDLEQYRLIASVIRSCGDIACPGCGCVDPMNNPPGGTPIPIPNPWPNVISISAPQTP